MSNLVPKNLEIPETLETDRFRLRMLTVNDVVKDYDAVMTSIKHLQKTKPFGPEPKPFTAVGVLHYVDRGTFDLDADIKSYLKSWTLPDSNVASKTQETIRQLLAYSGGLSPGWRSAAIKFIFRVKDQIFYRGS